MVASLVAAAMLRLIVADTQLIIIATDDRRIDDGASWVSSFGW